MAIWMLLSKVITIGLAGVLAVGFGAVTLATAPAAHANGLTITNRSGKAISPQGTACTITPGTPCISYVGGVVELAYVSSLNIEQISITSGNLTIHVFGDTNVIGNTSMTGKTALSVAGGLTVLGKTAGAKLMIDAADGTAISIGGAPNTLTLGNGAADPVTLQVTAGTAPAENDSRLTIGTGSSYTLPGPGPGPGPEPGTFMVGAVRLVYNGEKTANSVPGVTVELVQVFDLSFWVVTLDGNKGPFDPITITGGEGFHFAGVNAPIAVRVDETSGLSIDATDENVGILFTGGAFHLSGGIATNDTVRLDGDVFVRVGSSGTRSPKGVKIGHSLYTYNEGRTGEARLEIYTSGVGISAAATTQPMVQAQSNGIILIDSAEDATAGLTKENVSVANGGILDFTFGAGKSLGILYAYSSFWPEESEAQCLTETPEREPTFVAADSAGDFLSDPTKQYRLTTSLTEMLATYKLESGAAPLVNLSWEQGTDAQNPVTDGQVCVLASRGSIQIDQGRFFSYSIEAGSAVTIKLLPFHEYQFTSGKFTFSGPIELKTQTFAAAVGEVEVDPITANAAEYTFVMPDGNIELTTVFDAVPDGAALITGTSDVTAGSVSGAPETINGNAQLTIGKGAPTDEAEFEDVAGTRTVASYLDVSVEQVIEQGDTGGEWTQPLIETPEPVSVSMQLDTALQGFSDYQVLREHEGVVEAVPTTYDATTGTITFETDKFSTYAIAHGAKVANPNTYDEGSDWQMVGMFGSLAGLIAIASIYLIRRRYPIG